MSIQIEALTLGIAATNCYVIGDNQTKEAVVIDPVDNAARIQQAAQAHGWTIKKILATHGHFDHVLASKSLKEQTGAPFYIHEEGPYWLDSMPQQGLMFVGQPFPEAAKPDVLLSSALQTITQGAIKLETLFTPGHSHDHISFFMPEQRILFGGDCLFAGSIGRTDLPHGDYDTLMRSIVDRLLPLGDDVRLLPGHMQETTIGRERQTNPFVLDYTNT